MPTAATYRYGIAMLPMSRKSIEERLFAPLQNRNLWQLRGRWHGAQPRLATTVEPCCPPRAERSGHEDAQAAVNPILLG